MIMTRESSFCRLSGLLPKPHITLQPADLVSWGQPVSITCVVTDGLIGSFNFTKTPGHFIHTVNSSSNSATFNITKVCLENEGLYQCQFQRRVFNEDSPTYFSDPVWLIGNCFISFYLLIKYKKYLNISIPF